MSIRAGMVPLVALLRQRTSAAEDDVFDGVAYWTDEQLQDILDQYKKVNHYLLFSYPYTDEDGANRSRLSWAPNNRLEGYEEDLTTVYRTDGGVDLVGAGTATIDHDTRLVTFTSAYQNTAATDTHEIVLITYDMNEAAREVWEQKASQRAEYVRTKAGQHTMDMQDEWEHCIKMAQGLRSRKIRAHQWGRKTKFASHWRL